MIKQKQLFRHKPEEGLYGDCHRTCIACLMDCDVTDVPNFGEHYGNVEAFFAAEKAFLKSRNLAMVNIPFVGDSLENTLNAMKVANPGQYFILGGQSRTGVNHSVIACDGEIVWDPSLTDAGIIGPCSDTYYWVSFLVPLWTTRDE